jgi:hypothetical protein
MGGGISMSEEKLIEQVKELEVEIEKLKAEQEIYKRIIEAKHSALSQDLGDNISHAPVWISQWVRNKTVHSLSEDEQNVGENILQKHLDEAVGYICGCK